MIENGLGLVLMRPCQRDHFFMTSNRNLISLVSQQVKDVG